MADYKIRTKSGRELGPLSADAIQKLIEKNQLSGSELVCSTDGSDWVPFRSIEELRVLLPEDEEGERTRMFNAPEGQGFGDEDVEPTNVFFRENPLV